MLAITGIAVLAVSIVMAYREGTSTDARTGLFMYHCHNLEHEDGGMMRNFRVS